MDPDWLSAIVATVALGLAFYSARLSYQARQAEQARDRAREDEALRAQAAKVIALPGHSTTRYEDPSGPGVVDLTSVAVIIRNASDLPVYDVVVDDPSADDDRPPSDARPIAPPGDTTMPVRNDVAAAHLNTPQLRDYATRHWGTHEDVTMGDVFAAVLDEWKERGRPAITFTDAAGHRWHRDTQGRLTQIDSSPTPPTPRQRLTKPLRRQPRPSSRQAS